MKISDNQDKATKYLSKIRDVEKEIRGKRLELEALRYKATGAGAIRYDKDRVQTTPQDYMTMAINDAIELEHQIEEDEVSIDEKVGEILWSLQCYRKSLSKLEEDKSKEIEELERSIIARLSDDVKIWLTADTTEVIIEKLV